MPLSSNAGMFGGFSNFFPLSTISIRSASGFVPSNFFSAVAPWQAKHFVLYKAAASSCGAVRPETEAIKNVAETIKPANTNVLVNRVIRTILIASWLFQKTIRAWTQFTHRAMSVPHKVLEKSRIAATCLRPFTQQAEKTRRETTC